MGKQAKARKAAQAAANTNTAQVPVTPTPNTVQVQQVPASSTNTNTNTLYVVIGTKRGLTGNGGGIYSNANTMQHMASLPGATTTGLTYAQYYAACVAYGHKGFCAYAFKSGWLQPVVAPATAPAQVQGVSAA